MTRDLANLRIRPEATATWLLSTLCCLLLVWPAPSLRNLKLSRFVAQNQSNTVVEHECETLAVVTARTGQRRTAEKKSARPPKSSFSFACQPAPRLRAARLVRSAGVLAKGEHAQRNGVGAPLRC